jgi:TolB protein
MKNIHLISLFVLFVIPSSLVLTASDALKSGKDPQDKIVFFSDRDGNNEIYVMNDNGSAQRRLTNNDSNDTHPKFSPNGEQIAFLSDRNGPGEIFVMNSNGSDVRQITKSIPGVHFPSFSADGSKLIFNSVQKDKRVLMIMDLTNGKTSRYLRNKFDMYHPAWSPSGDKIAFDIIEGNNQDICVANTDGSGFMRLTENAKGNFFPAWSPDGKHIAYIGGRNRNLDICVMKADGSGKKYLTSHEALDEFPSWGPDGKHIVFESRRTGKKQIFIIGSDGTGLKQITFGNYNNSFPDWCKVSYSERKKTSKNQKIESFPVLKGPYLGQELPGIKAELFAPEVITYEVHGSPSILPDEKGMLVASMSEGMKFYKMVDGVLQMQKVSPFDIPDNCNGMFLSPSGKRLYFLIWENDDENFYMSEKKRGKWTKPLSLGEEVNSFKTHWQFSVARSENLCFSSEGDIVVSFFQGGTHLKPVSLKLNSGKNLEGGTPYISPDESYILYSMAETGNDNSTDLYISYRENDGRWSMPKNLGANINSPGHYDLCPKVSPNGKFLFFISRRNGPDFQIYWADAKIIEESKPKEQK